MSTYVLLHGSWHGAWCWDSVGSRLQASGDHVRALTLRGLGERADELGPDIDLRAHAEDLEQQLAAAANDNAVLVAHSYGGMVVAWIAARLPDYGVRRVVLLDAFVPLPGETALDVAPSLRDALMGLRMTDRAWALAAPGPELFGIEDPLLAEEVSAKLTPMPLATHTQALREDAEWPQDIPVDYIRCLQFPAFEAMQERVEARKGWRWLELDAGHDAMLTCPNALISLLHRPSG